MDLERVHEQIDREFPQHLRDTQTFLRHRSISSEGLGLAETAGWLAGFVQGAGGAVELAGDPNAPIVFARFDLGRPQTLLVYGMYDVQPVSGQVWSVPPFSARIRGVPGIGRCIVARGACNSKGPLMGFLNAIRAIRRVAELPVNLLITIEGEEEIGSPTLPGFYVENRDRLQADAGFEPFWAEYGTDVEQPTLALGTKGLVSLELVCRSGEWGGPVDGPIHSSVGAWLGSPLWRLVQALATLVDEHQEIAVARLLAEVAPPGPADEQILARAAATFDPQKALDLLGAWRFKYSDQGVDLLRKYFFCPSLQLSFPEQGEEGLISPEARAQLTIRLVPTMEPARTAQVLREHLASRGYGDIEVTLQQSYPWSRTSLDAVVVQSLLAAYRYHQCEPQILPMLASASPYYLFSDLLGIPYAWGGLGRAGRSHAPDEYATVEGLRLLEKSLATFLFEFAKGHDRERNEG